MRILVIWIFVSVCLFLCPGPSFWYGIMHRGSSLEYASWSFLSEKIQVFLVKIEVFGDFIQLTTHFVMMAICAFFLSKEVSIKTPVMKTHMKLITTLLCVFLFSFFIEVIQNILPSSFRRGFDGMDIGFSMLGGLIGVGIALAVSQK